MQRSNTLSGQLNGPHNLIWETEDLRATGWRLAVHPNLLGGSVQVCETHEIRFASLSVLSPSQTWSCSSADPQRKVVGYSWPGWITIGRNSTPRMGASPGLTTSTRTKTKLAPDGKKDALRVGGRRTSWSWVQQQKRDIDWWFKTKTCSRRQFRDSQGLIPAL